MNIEQRGETGEKRPGCRDVNAASGEGAARTLKWRSTQENESRFIEIPACIELRNRCSELVIRKNLSSAEPVELPKFRTSEQDVI